MCTIHSYSAKFYRKNEREIHRQIIQDSVMNDDGISMLFLDGHASTSNTIYRTMDVDNFLVILNLLMHDATKHARVFIHLRAATTQNVGVGYTHAFDDMNGVVYMHNGVISNATNCAVDSFNMVSWENTTGGGLLTQLLTRKEYFANVFRIDMNTYEWTVTRMDGSSLFTDGAGNFSSKTFATLTTPVPQRSTQSFSLSVMQQKAVSNYYTPLVSAGNRNAEDTKYPKWKAGDRWDTSAREWVSEEEWQKRGLGGKTLPAITSTPEATTVVSDTPPFDVVGEVEGADVVDVVDVVDSLIDLYGDTNSHIEGTSNEDISGLDEEAYEDWLIHNTRKVI